MVDLFVEQTPLQLKQLKSAAADGRWSDFFAVAHKTKSSMAMMGVKSLQEKLVKLESYSKHKTNLHEVDDLLSEVDTACTKILKEISTIQVAANK